MRIQEGKDIHRMDKSRRENIYKHEENISSGKNVNLPGTGNSTWPRSTLQTTQLERAYNNE